MTIFSDMTKAQRKLLGSKGGKAGTGKAKARPSKQMRKAALKRWNKLEVFKVKSYRTNAGTSNIIRVRKSK